MLPALHLLCAAVHVVVDTLLKHDPDSTTLTMPIASHAHDLGGDCSCRLAMSC